MKKFLNIFLMVISFSQVIAQPLTWNAPQTISTLGVDSSSPLVTLDSSGNVDAAWIEGGVVKSSHLPLNGSWSAPDTVSNSDASSLKFVADPSGNVTAVWIESGVLKAATRPAGDSWKSIIALSGVGTASSPSLAVDLSGNVVAVWVQTSILNVVSLQSSTKLFNGNWQAVVDTISGSTNTPSSPYVYIGSRGNVFAVWRSQSGTNDLINSASKTIVGATWSTPINFFSAAATFRHNYPKVVVDALGNANALWFRFNQSGSSFSNVMMLSAQLPFGSSSWSIPSVLSDNSLRNPANMLAGIKIDTTGNLIATWNSSFDGYTFNVETARKVLGGNWAVGGTPILYNLYALENDVAVGSSGFAALAYMYFDGTSETIQVAESNIASSVPNYWSNQQTISKGTNNGSPRIATSTVDNTDYVCAVWIQNNESNNVIMAAIASKPVVLPPSNVSVSQTSTSFGVYTDYQNTITWKASPAPNLEGYAIYRNGIRFTSVDANTFQFVDHNASQNGAVTYGVAAFDEQYGLSQVVNVSFP